jgi:hypothetical protein
MSATVLAQTPVATSAATTLQQLVPITDRLRMMQAVDARPAGFGLQSAFYQDYAFFRADVENLWGQHWIFAGHDCELTSANDTITMQIAEYPVSIVRGEDGKLGAFCTGMAQGLSRLLLTQLLGTFLFRWQRNRSLLGRLRQ